MLKAYKYRLLPTGEQKHQLDNGMGACRFIYNLALETKIRAWESGRVNLTAYDLMKQLTELKKSGEANWLNDVCGMALQSSISKMDVAFKNFYNGAGYPKFKKKSHKSSMHFRLGTKVSGKRVRLEKYGWFDMVYHRAIPDNAEIRSATVSKMPSGAYFVSILVQDGEPLPIKKIINEGTSIGIDLGIKSFAVLSDGQEIENPKFLSKEQALLRIEKRTLDRRYKRGVTISAQSKGWHSQRLVVAKLHEKITNKRSDFLHKISDSITKCYDTICLESLNIKGMVKNSRLSKAISDASWGELVAQLEYKSEWRGKNISRINTFAPSSKTCSDCGEINSELTLADRSWTCQCGSIHNRDLNAAINIKNMGLRQALQSLT